MTIDFIPKRPHKKSRGGCQTCKTRKIKCDEVQPKCGYCNKRDLSCNFVIRSTRAGQITPPSSEVSKLSSKGGSPAPHFDEQGPAELLPMWGWDITKAPRLPSPALSASGSLSPIDIKLMHHWSTMTWSRVAIGDPANNTLLIAVPQLAFENDYLLQGILGIASMHMERLDPTSLDHQKRTAIYRAKSLATYRQALTTISDENSSHEAALCMAVILVVLYTEGELLEAGELLIVNWITLYRGLSAIFMLKKEKTLDGLRVGPLFTREISSLRSEPTIPTVLILMMQEVQPHDEDFPMLEIYCKTLDCLGILYASLKDDGLSPALYIRVVCWSSFMTDEFHKCAKEKRPRALVILAHYLTFLKIVRGLWWVEGVSDHDIEAIGKTLGPMWFPYLMVPLQALSMTDGAEIAKLLLT